MALYENIAPEISEFVTEVAAKNFAENLLTKPVPVYRTLNDLENYERTALFTWLKWFGQNRKPHGVSEWINWSPGKVATELNMTKAYVLSLVAERNAIVNEVAQWGNDAFLPHTPPNITNVILGGETILDGYEDVLSGYIDVLDGYTESFDEDGYVVLTPNYVSTPTYVSTPNYVFVSDGNFTITGTTFLSYSNTPTYVTFKRGATTVTKSKAQIEAGGGSVSDTEIFVTDGTLPVTLQTGDIVTIYANNLVSQEYVI